MIDVDSFVGEVCGRLKQGAAYGYTRLLGYHPILATRADTRETLHIRLRKGSANTQKGMLRFCEELIARVAERARPASSSSGRTRGSGTPRSSSASNRRAGSARSACGMIKTVHAAIEAIDEDAWKRIHYPEDGEAQNAETGYGGRRVIVPRTRLLGPRAELWPESRHSP